MNIEIRKMTPQLINEYFEFFEQKMFAHKKCYKCYCQRIQMSMKDFRDTYDNIAQEDFLPVSKEIAIKQINNGQIRGYLAFHNGEAIGWVNANDRFMYPADSVHCSRIYAPEDVHEKAVVCFAVAPEYRNKGVATSLLQKVIDDARNEGYNAIESYPFEQPEYWELDYEGPVHLYEKAGFVKTEEVDDYIIMRLELREEQ